MSKESFFKLLGKAIKPDSKEPKKQEQQNSAGYNGKQTRPNRYPEV